MSYRTIYIGNPAKLSVINKQLKITQEQECTIPIEDISTVILESQQTNITGKVLSEFVDNNVITYICNDKHIPNGIIIPFNKHSRQLKIIKYQLLMSEPFKKRLWQLVVKQKISNQAKVLKLNGLEGYEFINKLSTDVLSGDSTNREAVAAKFYFQELYESNFNRDSEDIRNSLLNYGYTIIRGAIARTLVAYGYIPSLGIHHKNELNNYNLADDFIEPFRPVVDLWVSYSISKYFSLTTDAKKEILNLLNVDMLINNQKHSILNAIDKMIASYTTAIQDNDINKLLLPELIKLDMHRYE